MRQAMLVEMDPAEQRYADLETRLARRLLEAAGVSSADSEVRWMSGTSNTAIELAVRSLFQPAARVLIPSNGPLAGRAAATARMAGMEVVEAAMPAVSSITPAEVEAASEASGAFDGLLLVHAEPDTGVLNPLAPLGRLARERGWRFIVDATFTFGAYPIDLGAFEIDAMAACSGFSLESAPGLGILLASKRRGQTLAASVREDTPAIPLLLALDQALVELEQEGGIEGRAARYRDSHQTLLRGMTGLGFRASVRQESRSYLTTRFQPPSHFDAGASFVEALGQRGYRVGAGPVIATLGRIYPATIEAFLDTLREYLGESHAAA
ncbi:MAG: aminotransferase class V-fold PLP-dependent enzyme [Bryobacter sp.]|nr:aminotransferase class V-fold PLP-dependent enzyme [Bryobacter sp.]